MNTQELKRRTRTAFQLGVCAAALGFGSGMLHAAPTPEAFTYQGVLNLDGEMYDGQADLRFRLYESAGGTVQVGTDLYLHGATIEGGLIIADLDFGPAVFTGDERWLEISVRTPAWDGMGDEPAYAVLNPLQAILPTPYAMYALNGNPARLARRVLKAPRVMLVQLGPPARKVLQVQQVLRVIRALRVLRAKSARSARKVRLVRLVLRVPKVIRVSQVFRVPRVKLVQLARSVRKARSVLQVPRAIRVSQDLRDLRAKLVQLARKVQSARMGL